MFVIVIRFMFIVIIITIRFIMGTTSCITLHSYTLAVWHPPTRRSTAVWSHGVCYKLISKEHCSDLVGNAGLTVAEYNNLAPVFRSLSL